MKYDHDLWNKYTKENEGIIQQKLADFIYHISLILGAKTILEVGCNVGNNLSGFPSNSDVHGLDMNKIALEKVMKKYPSFKFKEGSLLEMPYQDSQFDLVFSRGVLIHISQSDMPNAINEMIRMSKKWICNMEYYGEDGKMISWKRGDDLLWYRDMKKWWNGKNVEIISEIDLPEELDIGKTRLTIVRKKLKL